jgi:hypothetical protein
MGSCGSFHLRVQQIRLVQPALQAFVPAKNSDAESCMAFAELRALGG